MDSFILQSSHFILPITVAVAGLFIYLFGFQSVKEPDYSYINNIVPTRKKKQQPVKRIGAVQAAKPATPVTKQKAEPTKSVAVHGKENGMAKKSKKADMAENSEELDQGDWLPAPTRGGASRKAKQQSSPKKVNASSPGSAKKSILKEVQNTEVPVAAKHEDAQKSAKKEDAPNNVVLTNANQSQEVGTPDSGSVGTKDKAAKSNGTPQIVEGTPLTENTDLWEESKSRGNKKKSRARKE